MRERLASSFKLICLNSSAFSLLNTMYFGKLHIVILNEWNLQLKSQNIQTRTRQQTEEIIVCRYR